MTIPATLIESIQVRIDAMNKRQRKLRYMSLVNDMIDGKNPGTMGYILECMALRADISVADAARRLDAQTAK